MAFTVYRSNRMEALAEALGELLGREPPGPFEAELIVVQSKGMERWLSLSLAERFGVFAQAAFPFPRAFAEAVLEAFEAGQPFSAVLPAFRSVTPDPYEPAELGWHIAKLLPELLAKPGFAPLQAYLGLGQEQQRRFELAGELARLLDQYALYRPDLTLAWAKGEESDFQAELWRSLRQLAGKDGLGERVANAARALSSGEKLKGLPRRVSVFGVSALAPVYLSLFEGLSRVLPVHLFVLDPSREYWGDLLRKAGGGPDLRPPRVGGLFGAQAPTNRLLESLGKVGRQLQELLLEVQCEQSSVDRFVEPGEGSLLAALQHDMLWLRQPGVSAGLPGDPSGETPTPARLLRAHDASISIHSCHSPLREVEVLRDQLLSRFEADPTLEPRDIVVMTPDLASYAPLIDAVFAREPRDPGFIPYSVSDRNRRSESLLLEAFLVLLRTLGGRMKATELLDLLEFEPIARKFGFTRADVGDLERWVKKGGMRWGLDEAHKAEREQPELHEHTWAFGLSRLLLGWAMPGGERHLFFGCLPEDSVEGEGARLTGQLAELCAVLFERVRSFRQPQPAGRWQSDLLGLAEAVFDCSPEEAWEFSQLRAAIVRVFERARAAGCVEALELATVTTLLERELEQESNHHAFLSRGITFCAMVPMRSVPFRVVALLGMTDGKFPRTAPSLGFDRMAAEPRLGDRSIRDEDRYLFLEALLAARDALLITYVGRDIQDNTERPPSVVVGELISHIEECFALEGEAAAAASTQLIVEHPLAAFSPRNFGSAEDPRLFSYAEAEARGAARLAQERVEPRPFVTKPLPEAEGSNLTLERLKRFLREPLRGLVESRLGLRLAEVEEVVADREPLELDALQGYGLGSWLLECRREGLEWSRAFELARARGAVPPGAIGQAKLEELAEAVDAIWAAAAAYYAGSRREPLAVELTLGNVQLTGALRDLWPQAQVSLHYGRLYEARLLGAWVDHLALQCARSQAQQQGLPECTLVFGRAPKEKGSSPVCEERCFAPLSAERARALLGDLVDLYVLGQAAPLRFFPKAAGVYLNALANRRPPASGLSLDDLDAMRDEALAEARKKERNAQSGGFARETQTPYARLCLAGRDPFGTETLLDESEGLPSFAELSERILGPMLECLREP